MIVHFIGGPAHGRTEAIQNPRSVYRMPELRRMPVFAKKLDEFVSCPDIIEHEYRITRQTPRYAIAEWQAPPVDVEFQVDIEIDPDDHKAADKLSRFLFERRREKAAAGVQCTGASRYSYEKVSLTLVTRVEGPSDAVAIQLAAERIQHYLDAELPPCKRWVEQTAASTR